MATNFDSKGFHNYRQDTIAALSTPMGKGAIAVIRVSGKDAFNLVAEHFRTKETLLAGEPFSFSPKNRYYGLFVDKGRIVDEVMLSLYRKPHSYTGEDVVEISCHCNSFIIEEILSLLLRKGRMAAAGEFTQRAFLNGKMDLTRAEAVGDLLNAATFYSHKAAIGQLEGTLFLKIRALLEKITHIRIEYELEIDFIEQDVPVINTDEVKKQVSELIEEMTGLLASSKNGLLLREGITVSLIGVPNVGKSSLFNHLLSCDRAIVTKEPGTTRDYLEESLSINGFLVKLYDTAGIREAGNEAEQIGIDKTRELIHSSQRIIYMEDGDQAVNQRVECGLNQADERIITVLNKADLQSRESLDEYRKRGYLICSLVSGEGISELKQRITDVIQLDENDFEKGMLSNIRQVKGIERALESLERARAAIRDDLGFEFIAYDLKEASEALEEIIGRITDDDILNRIFDGFCVGK